MIICVCQNVSERDIAKAVASGCHSFAALQDHLEVGRCCGTCECAARESFAEHRQAQRPAHGMQAMLSPMTATA